MLLKEKLKDKRLILASGSPRRRELLEGAGLDFIIGEDTQEDESYPEDIAASELPLYIARQKSLSYPVTLEDNDILITADTLVILDGNAMGKPADREEAMDMLRRMSGEQHTVITGVVIRNNEHIDAFSVKTDVWFRKLDEHEIEYYVDNYQPYDKAGGYGIQEWIGYVGIGRIEGSFYNVTGLPIQALYVALGKFVCV